MGEEDIGRTIFTLFDADDELVAFASRVDATQADFIQQAAQAVLRDFGSVFCPLGFHLTDGWFFRFNVETVFLPEHFQQRPNFARRFAIDNQQRWLPSRSRRTPLTDFKTSALAGCCTA